MSEPMSEKQRHHLEVGIVNACEVEEGRSQTVVEAEAVAAALATIDGLEAKIDNLKAVHRVLQAAAEEKQYAT